MTVDVSVMTPFYNTPPGYLRECVESSLMDQGDVEQEIILVDDGSEIEGPVQTAEKLDEEFDRVRFFHRDHQGLASVRNFCLEKARGDLIAVMDSDDKMVPGRLERQFGYMKEHPDCVITAGNRVCIGPDGTVITRTRHSDLPNMAHAKIDEERPFGALVHGTAMYRRSPALQVGGYETFQDHKPGGGEDAQFYQKLYDAGMLNYHLMDEYLILRRVWPGSYSFVKGSHLRSLYNRWHNIR